MELNPHRRAHGQNARARDRVYTLSLIGQPKSINHFCVFLSTATHTADWYPNRGLVIWQLSLTQSDLFLDLLEHAHLADFHRRHVILAQTWHGDAAARRRLLFVRVDHLQLMAVIVEMGFLRRLKLVHGGETHLGGGRVNGCFGGTRVVIGLQIRAKCRSIVFTGRS